MARKTQIVANPGLHPPLGIPGSGASCANAGRSSETGLTACEEARVTHRAIRKGWIKPREYGGWPLNLSRRALAEKLDTTGELNAIEEVLLTTLKDLHSAQGNVRQMAVRSVVAMHAQNLAVDHHDERMDFHERSLEARTGRRNDNNVPAEGGMTIFIPHNYRGDPPPNTVGLVIEGTEVPGTPGGGGHVFDDELPPEDGGP